MPANKNVERQVNTWSHCKLNATVTHSSYRKSHLHKQADLGFGLKSRLKESGRRGLRRESGFQVLDTRFESSQVFLILQHTRGQQAVEAVVTVQDCVHAVETDVA